MNSKTFKTLSRRVVLGIGTKQENLAVERWCSTKPKALEIYLETLQYYSSAVLHQLRKTSLGDTASAVRATGPGLGLVRGDDDSVVRFEPYNGKIAQYQVQANLIDDGRIAFQLTVSEWFMSPADGALTAFLTRNEGAVDQQAMTNRRTKLMLDGLSHDDVIAVKVMDSERSHVDSFPIDVSALLCRKG